MVRIVGTINYFQTVMYYKFYLYYLANKAQSGLFCKSFFPLESLLPLAFSALCLGDLTELLGLYLPDALAGLLRRLKTGGRQPASKIFLPTSTAFFL